jgi:prepilin-type N-terminal cleavage/methylation domain-containing protein
MNDARHHEGGFTLVEILIVIVIIGILAAISIPQFQDTKSRAALAVLKTDLRNLRSAEEGYYFEHDAYTSVISNLDVTPSPGVVINVVTATASGWGAIATNPQPVLQTCALFYGNVASVAPATVEGIIDCK